MEIKILKRKSPQRQIREGYIEITPAIIEEIKSHIKRTGVAVNLFMNISGIKSVHRGVVQRWANGVSISGEEKAVKEVLKVWRALPDNYYVELTQEISSFLQKEIKRTGMGPTKILRGNKVAKEAEISAAKIYGIINLEDKRMESKRLDIILNLWSDVPDKEEYRRKKSPEEPRLSPVTPEYLQKIESEIERTKIKPDRALKAFNVRKPTATTVNNWFNGRSKKAPKTSLNMLSEIYSKIPNAN